MKRRFMGADIFGYPIGLNYKQKPIFNTFFGGFLSIVISTLTFCLFLIKMVSMAQMAEPNVLIL